MQDHGATRMHNDGQQCFPHTTDCNFLRVCTFDPKACHLSPCSLQGRIFLASEQGVAHHEELRSTPIVTQSAFVVRSLAVERSPDVRGNGREKRAGQAI